MTHTASPRQPRSRAQILARLLGVTLAGATLLGLGARAGVALADQGPTTYDDAAWFFNSAIGEAQRNGVDAASWGQTAYGDGADALSHANSALDAAKTCDRAHFQVWVDLYASAKQLEQRAAANVQDRISQASQNEDKARKRQDDMAFFATTPDQQAGASAANDQLTAQITTDLTNAANARNSAGQGDGFVAQADQIIKQAQAAFDACNQMAYLAPIGPDQPAPPQTTPQPYNPMPTATATLQLSQQMGPAGTLVTLTGSGFTPNTQFSVCWTSGFGGCNEVVTNTLPGAAYGLRTDAAGSFSVLIRVPADTAGTHRIGVRDQAGREQATTFWLTSNGPMMPTNPGMSGD